MICSIEGCLSKALARRFCQRHYDAWRYHGDPLVRMKASNGEPLDWLIRHARHEGDDCLIWPFGKSDGRGVVCIDGTMGLASRAMCRIAHGPAPRNKPEAAHSCGKGHLACVHPKHLRWASTIENHADMVAHGTVVRGERNPAAKVSEAEVKDIVLRLAQGEKGKIIAETVGVTKQLVSDIKLGKTWAWLTGIGIE